MAVRGRYNNDVNYIAAVLTSFFFLLLFLYTFLIINAGAI